MTGANAILTGGALGAVSTVYMLKYGHGLPKEHAEHPINLKPNQISNTGFKYVY